MEYFHLTTPQQNIWNLQKYYSNTAISNLCGAVFYEEKRDKYTLKKAVQTFIREQSAMRLRFVEETEVLQYIVEDIDEILFRSFKNRKELDLFAENLASTPMELTEQSLYKIVIFEVEDRSGLLVLLNHLIADAWTFGIMANRVDALYRALVCGAEIDRKQGNYQEFIQGEKEYFLSQRYKKDDSFWNHKYAELPVKNEIKANICQRAGVEGKRYSCVLSGALWEEMEQFCKDNFITPAVMFELVLVLYLYKINDGNSMVTVGVPVLNRSSARQRRIAGMFVATLPLTVKIEENMSVLEVAGTIAKEHGNLFRHMKYPYADILKNIRTKHGMTDKMYDVMISYQNAKTNAEGYTKWYANGCSETPLILHIDNRDGNNCYTINVDYQTSVFTEEAEIVHLMLRMRYILEQVVSGNRKQIADIQIVPQREKVKLLEQWNDTYVRDEKWQSIAELFEKQVEATPDKTALIYGDKQYTYESLMKKVDQMVNFLDGKGVKKGDKIAVLLNRDEKVVITQLAVLKAGAVFIPIDSRYPYERIQFILSESGAKFIVKNQSNPMKFFNECEVENYERYESRVRETTGVSEEDLCYIIFTSGSTGMPKGCALTQEGIANFCRNNNILSACDALKKQICVSVNTISFDFFIAESLLPLIHGYTVVLASERESTDLQEFAQLVMKRGVNIMQTTPTRYHYLLEKNKEDQLAKQLEVIVSSGEALTGELYQYFRRNTKAKIFNPLGPSECSVWVLGGELTDTGNIHIGKPIANTQVYILNSKGNLMPAGVAGELCIAGKGVGRGYLNQPELTRQRFVKNPFSTEKNHHGNMLYRTGDLACFGEDGNVYYLGRIDHQVKIHGLRIELGEIENVMMEDNRILMAAAAARKDAQGRQFLVGYYTAEEEIRKEEIRARLAEKLPVYMVPNYLVKMKEMPLTASGKINRKVLPQPDFSKEVCTYVAPETKTEQLLCKLFQDVLGADRIGTQDNFFSVGGDSLAAIDLTIQAKEKGIEVTLQDIFDYNTVQKLANYLHGKKEQKENCKVEVGKYKSIFYPGNTEVEGKKHPLGNLLLTGATGYLGAHVLDQFMKEEKGRIYCVVREGAKTAEEKLWERLRYYFEGRYETEIGRRIIPVQGDITDPQVVGKLPRNVQTVIHTAADVRHYGIYETLWKTNVMGTQNMTEYACKTGAEFVHISTTSVSGNGLTRTKRMNFEDFDETKFYVGQSLENVYVKSKWEAEQCVYDAMLSGMRGMVIRVGNLTNDMENAKFQPNKSQNAFVKRMEALLQMEKMPEYMDEFELDFSPVDQVAVAIIKITQYRQDHGQKVFHLNNFMSVNMKQFVDAVRMNGKKIQIISDKEFFSELERCRERKETQFIYKVFMNDVDENGQLYYKRGARFFNEITRRYLKKIGVVWGIYDEEYVENYIHFLLKAKEK